MKRIVIHYDEIALKGGRRRLFQQQLVNNVRCCSHRLGDVPVHPLHDRILVGPLAEEHLAEAADRLSNVPGISWHAEVAELPLDAESLCTIAEEFSSNQPRRRFRVRAQRSNKNFPLKSLEIERQVGRMIQDRTAWPVDLSDPELTVFIDVTTHGILVYHAKRRGLGGLPVGGSGSLVGLLSGGIDSPVAAFKMMCRGCRVILVHFHNFGPQSGKVREKILALAEHLARFQPLTRVYLLPFAKVQSDLIAAIPPKMRTIAYRRAMLRLATPIVEAERAGGFVVGDSVGQVASQTLENLAATYPATSYPVLAPLIGEAKKSIIAQARRIGTYQTSILPYDDCCKLLVAKSPETRCALTEIQKHEEQLPLEKHAADVRQGMEVIDIAQPDMKPQAAQAAAVRVTRG